MTVFVVCITLSLTATLQSVTLEERNLVVMTKRRVCAGIRPTIASVRDVSTSEMLLSGDKTGRNMTELETNVYIRMCKLTILRSKNLK